MVRDTLQRMLWDLIVTTLYLFLPAYVANMAPVFVTRWNILPRLARPVDGGRRLNGQELFGPHKTIRGIVVGVLGGVLVAIAQKMFAERSLLGDALALFPYHERSAILWGILMGGGALAGDLAKSFLKRRFGIPPGARWFPWDQLDMIVGALVFGSLLFHFPLSVVITAIIVTPLVGLLVNVGGYMLNLKEAW